MTKKYLIYILTIISILFSCSKKPITIKYWIQETTPYVKASKVLVEKFNSSQNNINVDMEYFPFEGRYEVMTRKAFEDKREPDLLLFYGSTLFLAKKQWIQPVPENIISNFSIEKNFYPSALVNRKYNDKYYGLPLEINIESPGLLINKNIFENEKIKIPLSWYENNGPENWNELYDIAKKLTIIENNKIIQSGLGVFNRQEESMFLSLIWQYGGDYRDKNNNKVHFKTDEAKKALVFMKNLINGDNRINSYFVEDAFDQFHSGKSAMIIGAPWYCSILDEDKNFEHEYFNLPAFIKNSNPYFVGEGGWGLIVSSRSKYPEEAWEFVKFLIKKNNMYYWAESVGSISSNKNYIKDNLNKSNNNKKCTTKVSEILKYGKDPGAYTMDTYTLIWIIIRKYLRSYLLGTITLDQALESIENEGNKMILDNLGKNNGEKSN